MELVKPEPRTVTLEYVDVVFGFGGHDGYVLRQGQDTLEPKRSGWVLVFRDEAGTVVETITLHRAHVAMLSRRTRQVEDPEPASSGEESSDERER
jgi:hypothetical protein